MLLRSRCKRFPTFGHLRHTHMISLLIVREGQSNVCVCVCVSVSYVSCRKCRQGQPIQVSSLFSIITTLTKSVNGDNGAGGRVHRGTKVRTHGFDAYHFRPNPIEKSHLHPVPLPRLRIFPKLFRVARYCSGSGCRGDRAGAISISSPQSSGYSNKGSTPNTGRPSS